MTTATAPSARELLLALKFNESDWVRNSGRFARYVGQGPGGGGGGAGAAAGNPAEEALGELEAAQAELARIDSLRNEYPDRRQAAHEWLAADRRVRDAEAKLRQVMATGARGTTNPADFVRLASPDDIEAMYTVPGVRAQIRELNHRPDGLSTTVDFYDDAGDHLGMAQRAFSKDGKVEHYLFTLAPSRQGEGLAARINEHAENMYREHGFKEIHLNADIDVGKYAWARQGYDFDRPREMNQMYHSMYRGMLARKHPDLTAPEIDARVNAHIPSAIESLSSFRQPLHAWEVAALDDGEVYTYRTTKGSEGQGHLGKSLMLGNDVYESPDWDGVKYISPGSQSRAVGDAYFSTKPGTESFQKKQRLDRNERRRRAARGARR